MPGGLELSARQARRAQLVAQGLLGRPPRGGPAGVLSLTRGIQLDTISVLARSHELIAFARLGPLRRQRIEKDYWGGPPFGAFEYWYHAACIVPLEEWPNFAFKREERRARGFRWHRGADIAASSANVLAQLRERGPLTASELGGAKRGGPWWDWSEVKIAAEWLLDVGEVVCASRRGYQRVYDLPERVLPGHLLGAEVPRPLALRRLVERAAAALGVATARDIAAYAGLKRQDVMPALDGSELTPARVEGWRQPAYVAPGALAAPEVDNRARARAVLVSPFDSIACDRARLEMVFGFRHRLEAYVPRPKRVHGYYTMPVLAGDRFVARVDPAREGSTLVARSVHLETDVPSARAVAAVSSALRRAAGWVGADSVAVERVEPEEAAPALRAALSS